MRNCVWTPRLGNDGKNTKNQIFFENLNGRLALEDGSDRRETLGKRESDDSQHFIFQCRKHFFRKCFKYFLALNRKSARLEELGIFERYRQMRLEKWPPTNLFSDLYDPWRRGKQYGLCFWSGFFTKNNLPFLTLPYRTLPYLTLPWNWHEPG